VFENEFISSWGAIEIKKTWNGHLDEEKDKATAFVLVDGAGNAYASTYTGLGIFAIHAPPGEGYTLYEVTAEDFMPDPNYWAEAPCPAIDAGILAALPDGKWYAFGTFTSVPPRVIVEGVPQDPPRQLVNNIRSTVILPKVGGLGLGAFLAGGLALMITSTFVAVLYNRQKTKKS
jgi:hypothetical protein